MKKQLESGLSGMVVLGSSGEAALLTEDEKIEVVKTVKQNIPDKQPIICGTGCESTESTLKFTCRVADEGVTHALIITPSYYQGQMKGEVLFRHYEYLATKSPIPIVLYNVPKFTNVDLDINTIERLAEHENIVGIKESGAELTKLIQLASFSSAKKFSVLIGNAGLVWAGLTAGCDGAILAACNFAPKEYVTIFNLIKMKQFEKALSKFQQVLPLAKYIVGELGVPGIKAAMDLSGLYGGSPRMPLIPVDESVRAEINKMVVKAEMELH